MCRCYNRRTISSIGELASTKAKDRKLSEGHVWSGGGGWWLFACLKKGRNMITVTNYMDDIYLFETVIFMIISLKLEYKQLVTWTHSVVISLIIWRWVPQIMPFDLYLSLKYTLTTTRMVGVNWEWQMPKTRVITICEHPHSWPSMGIAPTLNPFLG